MTANDKTTNNQHFRNTPLHRRVQMLISPLLQMRVVALRGTETLLQRRGHLAR